MAKEIGDIVRFERATEPAWAMGVIFALLVAVLINVVFFIALIQWGENWPTYGQTTQGLLLGNVFFGVALILVLYRRYFMDDLLVVKKRHPKYEDFLDKYEIE